MFAVSYTALDNASPYLNDNLPISFGLISVTIYFLNLIEIASTEFVVVAVFFFYIFRLDSKLVSMFHFRFGRASWHEWKLYWI